MKKRRFSDYINPWTIGTLLVLIGLFIWRVLQIYRNNFSGDYSPDQGVWGQFGDYVGGTLNPFLTAITFLAVLVTIALQKQELNDEKAQEKSRERQKKNEEFEKTFFELLKVRENIVEGTKIVSTFDRIPLQYSGRESYRHLYNFLVEHYKDTVLNSFILNAVKYKHQFHPKELGKLLDAFQKREDWYVPEPNRAAFRPPPRFPDWCDYVADKCKTETDLREFREYLRGIPHVPVIETVERCMDTTEIRGILEKAYQSFFEDKGYLIGHYFRNMHYHLKYFDEENKKNYLEKNLEFYNDLYRSHLSGYEIIMLFFNCLSDLSSPEFNNRVLVNKFLKDIEKHPFMHKDKLKDLLALIKT